MIAIATETNTTAPATTCILRWDARQHEDTCEACGATIDIGERCAAIHDADGCALDGLAFCAACARLPTGNLRIGMLRAATRWAQWGTQDITAPRVVPFDAKRVAFDADLAASRFALAAALSRAAVGDIARP